MAWDSVWEKIFQESNWGQYPNEELIRFIARNYYHVESRKDIKVLEVGCGTGANLWYLAREGFTIYGIDGSETGIAKARKRLDKECKGWNGSLVVGDITKLPFDDNYFDAVIDNQAVSCNSYENAVRIYDELARVTKVGGKIFSRTFATGTWGEGTGEKVGHNAWIVSEGPLYGKGYSRFTAKSEIPQLLRGFKIYETDLVTWTVNNMSYEIREWIIKGEKVE